MELLVHIGAPMSRADDNRFIAQASAYMGFVPASSDHVCEASELANTAIERENSREAPHLHPRKQSGRRSTRSRSPESLTNSPTLPESQAPAQQHPCTATKTPRSGKRPLSSPMEQLEILQSNWRSKAPPTRPVPCAGLAQTTKAKDDWIFDTQFAVSAIESQLFTQPISDSPGCSALETMNPKRSPKRCRVMEKAHMPDDKDPSVKPDDHTFRELDGSHGASQLYSEDGHSKNVEPPPRTPEPEIINSLLPSDYGISDITTGTPSKQSGTSTQDTEGSIMLVSPSATSLRRTEKGQTGLSRAQGWKSSEVVGHAVLTDAANDRQVLEAVPRNQPLSAPENSSTFRQPMLAIEPNHSPPKAVGKTPCESPDRSTNAAAADENQSKAPARRDFVPQAQQQVDNASSAIATTVHQRTRKPSPTPIIDVALSVLPREARAPPPPIGFTPSPPSQMTRKLQILAASPLLASRYKPAQVSREPGILERGRWEFTAAQGDAALSQTWPTDRQTKFWQSLCRLVTDGSLGGYTWCIRQPFPAGGESISAGMPIANQAAEDDALGRVRVFCWGEVARHMWLLLYTISDNKIKNVDARWIDSRGEVVIEMLSRQVTMVEHECGRC